MRRAYTLLAVALLTAACAPKPGSTDGGSSVVAPADPAPDVAFSGRFEAAPGVSGGGISFVISETGQIAEATLKGFALTDFDCGGSRTISSTESDTPTSFFPPIAITEVRFSRSGDYLAWDGVFDSATSVRGTIRSSIRE